MKKENRADLISPVLVFLSYITRDRREGVYLPLAKRFILLFIRGRFSMNSGNGLDLFISISLTYPELHAVRYDSDHDIISLQIAVQGDVAPEQEKDLLTRFKQCLALYHEMAGTKASMARVFMQRLSEITLFHFERDMSTMSEGEMGLLLDLTRDIISNRILYDTGDSITEEPYKNKVKQNLLRRISKNEDKHQFLAFRKQGRVLVFQK